MSSWTITLFLTLPVVENPKLTDTEIDYRCRQNTPIHAEYHGHKLFTVPAPASGAIWLSAMGTLSHFQPTTSGSVLDLHRLTESLRVSLSEKSFLIAQSWHTDNALLWGIHPLFQVWRKLSNFGYLQRAPLKELKW